MGLNFLSNKGSFAPYVYLLIQILLLTGIVNTCPDIVDFGNSFFVIFFWLNILITVGLFFYVHFLDPGYVPYDGVFFTEQEEPPLSVSHSHQLKYDSMMKLRKDDSKNMSHDFNFSPLASDLRFKGTSIMTHLSKAVEAQVKSTAADSAGLAESNVNLRNSTNVLSIGSPLPKPIKEEAGENANQSYDERYKNIQNGDEEQEEDEDRVDVSLSHEEISQEEEPTDLDAVIVEEKEGTRDTTKQQNAEALDDNEDEDEVLDMNDLRMKTEEYIASHQRIQSPTAVQRGLIANGIQNGLQAAYKGNYMMQMDDIAEEGDVPSTVVQDTQSKNPSPSPKKRYETFGQVKTTLQPEQYQYSAGLSSTGLEDTTNKDKKQDSNKKKQKASNKVEDAATKETRSSTGLNGFLSGRSTAELQAANADNYSIKLTIGDYNNMKSLVSEPTLPKGASDNAISSNQNKKSDHSDNELYIERRYCTACNLEQPLRSKHCRDCKRCVGRYDHHCPWIGTCIGELNHVMFCVYLLFQFIEVMWGEIVLGTNVFDHIQKALWSTEDTWRVILLLATTFFLCLVGSLVVFHFYIATQNLTTWEYLSWNKISYLKEWNPEWGSPFTKGFTENVKFFFSRKKSISRWKMPKFRAPLGQQEMMANQDK